MKAGEMKTLLEPLISIAGKCGRLIGQKFIAQTKPEVVGDELRLY